MRQVRPIAMCVAIACGAAPLAAQGESTAPRSLAPDSRSALLLEALAGTSGAAVGIAAVALLSRCGVDDLGCDMATAGAAGLAGVAGATLGTTLAARYTGSRRSAGGAALGALVGTAVGLGVHYAVNRNSDRNIGDAGVYAIFALTQGVAAAVGSRLVGAAKGMR